MDRESCPGQLSGYHRLGKDLRRFSSYGTPAGKGVWVPYHYKSDSNPTRWVRTVG